jgi:hypothetical protein
MHERRQSSARFRDIFRSSAFLFSIQNLVQAIKPLVHLDRFAAGRNGPLTITTKHIDQGRNE